MRSQHAPVDEVLGFEVSHARRDLLRHVEQRGGTQLVVVTVPQVVEQVAVTHKLHDHVEWRLSSANTCRRATQSRITHVFTHAHML